MDENSLFSLDEQATETAWRAAVDKALKGRPFDSLVRTTDDGIDLAPLYLPADDARPLGRSVSGPWASSQRIDLPDPADANTAALRELETGATGLTLVLASAPTAYGSGVHISDVASLDRTLEGVALDMAPTRLEAGGAGRGLAGLFCALVDQRGLDPAGVDVHFGLDPLGAMAAAGKLSASWDAVARRSADTTQAIAARGYASPVFLADGRPFHNGGASDAQELASVAASALAYLRAFVDGGLDGDAALRRIGLAVSLDQDQFAGIAKLRALRRIWARLAAECGVPDVPAHIHADTSWRMMTRYDAYTNLLRTTIAAFAAGVGGADSLTVVPFTQAVGLPDAFARRLARNTHTILLEESQAARVLDPAAGSGGAEARTEALAAKAWDLMRDIEKKGGLPAALASGWWQGEIATVRDRRTAAVRKRKLPIVGTSEYPLMPERRVEVLETSDAPATAPGKPVTLPEEGGGAAFAALIEAASGGATLADIGAGSPASGCTSDARPLAPMRLADPFETLRDKAEAVGEPTDRTVMIAGLGPLAENAARSAWVKAAFEAGGLITSAAATLDTPEAAVDAAKTAGVACVCLAGSDERYADMAAETARALKQAGVSSVYLAGKPGEQETALRQAGVDGFLHVGIDLVEALGEVQNRLGIAA
ncbi:methylmalonyl-CoA mutase family protein [Amorphus orientalis]|uniref:Methylmalonyl-CoA mutase n=1 Tax=Amorphus orientalis TaxID=649198 RepID=A0AAE3VSU1_9HYPH|nr:methylmalonyl-CoA mutase family protein [Amorphus orientalis]MDQ0317328.1 methylmalonyl-CoA mutase [Amorphus orientalis]